MFSYTFFEEEWVNLKLSKIKEPEIKNTARGTAREPRRNKGRQRKKGRNLKGNMKNTFVLKNIKNALNKTESEHENIGKEKKAENQSKLSESVPQTPQPSSSSWDMRKNTPTQGNESVFRSKQSLHRSVKQAEKYLPNSLLKKYEMLNNLASKYNLRTKSKNKRGPKKRYLSEDQEH